MDLIEKNKIFNFRELGDIDVGRSILGPTTFVSVYRLMQFSLRAALNEEMSYEKTNSIFVKAGKMAGEEFARVHLDLGLPFDEFFAQLSNKLIELKICIPRMESADHENLKFSVVFSEDLDCSGLPFNAELVCNFDEGFLAGIFGVFMGRNFVAEEIDCWASGGRICRFVIEPIAE